MKKGILLIASTFILGLVFFIAIALTWLSPSMDTEALTAADNLLAVGHTTEAIDIYEQLLVRGQENSTVYYNLGLAHYQNGDLQAAYHSFQQASELAPRDPDIRHNLSLVSNELGIVEPAGFITSLSQMSTGWLTINELALISLAIWLITGFIFLWILIVEPGKSRRLLQTTLFIALLFVLSSGALLSGRLLSTQSPSTSSTALAIIDTTTIE